MIQEFSASASQRVRELPRVTSSELADQIEKLRATGKDIVSLAGAPYWPLPEHVLQAAAEAVSRNENEPSKGFRELRQAIAKKLESEGATVQPESEILVTNGARHGLSRSGGRSRFV
jgi:aspartate aminotransferase